MRITQVNEMSDTPQDTNAPSSMDTNTDLQSVISPYIQQMSDNILDMDIPKLMDSQQVLSIETRNTPQSYPSITNDNNNITSLTIQVPVISNDVSKVTLQKDGVPNITVQDQGISNMRSQDPDVSIVSTNDTCVSNVTLQDPCVSMVSINDTGASNVTLQDPSVSIASLQYPCVPEGTLQDQGVSNQSLNQNMVVDNTITVTTTNSPVKTSVVTPKPGSEQPELVTTPKPGPEKSELVTTTKTGSHIPELVTTLQSVVTPEEDIRESEEIYPLTAMFDKDNNLTFDIPIEQSHLPEAPPPLNPDANIVLQERDHPQSSFLQVEIIHHSNKMYFKSTKDSSEKDLNIKTPSASCSIPDKDCNDFLRNRNDNVGSEDTETFINPGMQVSIYDFLRVPVPGNIYRVNSKHELVALKFIPGEVYQADEKGQLQPIGLFNFRMDTEHPKTSL